MFFNSINSSTFFDESNTSSSTSSSICPPNKKQRIDKFIGLNAPPLRSINNEMIILRKSKNCQNSSTMLPPPSPKPPQEKDYWVTVFGFDEAKDVDSIIKIFGRHGTIVKTSQPAPGNEGNWIHLRYSSPIHVQQALQRNGDIIGNHFIGVIQSPNISYGSNDSKERCEDFVGEITLSDENINDDNVENVKPKSLANTQMRSLAFKAPNSPSRKSLMERFFG